MKDKEERFELEPVIIEHPSKDDLDILRKSATGKIRPSKDMEKTNGQIAYEAYYKYSNGKSLKSGETLPLWKDLDSNIKKAWEAVGESLRQLFR